MTNIHPSLNHCHRFPAETIAEGSVANVIKGCRLEPIAFYEARISNCSAIDGVGLKANLACCFRII